MINIKSGDIIIVNNWDGNFLSAAIRFFTKSWSHTQWGFFPIVSPTQQRDAVFEANLLVGITDWEKTFNNSQLDLRVYRWTRILNIEAATWSLFDDHNDDVYGWWQLPFFVWRWLVQKLHLPKKWAIKNFFPNREICTGIIYIGLLRLNDSTINSILAKFDFNQFTVCPGDIINICEELVRAGLLQRIYNRER
jgi:hypothetical protein